MAAQSAPIRVAVHGATGRMGRLLLTAIEQASDTMLVASVSQQKVRAHAANGDIVEHHNVVDLLRETQPDVVIDFTIHSAVLPIAKHAATHGAHVVTGTSGLTPETLEELRIIASEHNVGVMVGPNFSLGAVVLEHAVREAGRHYEYAEIIEMHHAGKADAPSGSAMATARALVEGRSGKAFSQAESRVVNVDGVRGGSIDGVAIHSVRLPGLMAHQQVILGGPGETLTFRHDVIDRESYMPGVLLAIREICNYPGKLVYGLGALLWSERSED